MNNTYIFLLLLGSYYGFLATLPIGPSKLLCVRNFLITTKGSEGLALRLESANSLLIAGVSGLIIAQVFILLSIYSPSLYALWLKPHVFNLLFIPILFLYFHKLRLLEADTYNDQLLGEPSLYKTRIQTAFLETLFIQLLNPIIFPNAVFSRLMGVFLFRYSHIMTFITGIFLGLLSGYAVFVISTYYLLKRLEQDTPTIYRLVKRVIHQAFFPIFFSIGLICLGRAPLPSIKNFTFNQESWQEKAWPDIFYSHDISKLPVRLMKNNQTGSKDDKVRAFNKMYFSQYFFEVHKKDGQRKLYHNSPQSLSLVSRDLNQLLQIPEISQESETKVFDEWIQEKENRKKQIENSIKNRLFSLGKGILFEDIVEKKLGSINYNGNTLSKQYDPRLGIDTRGQELTLENTSPLLLTESDLVDRTSILSSDKANLLNTYTNNRLKLFFSENQANLNQLPIMSWKPEYKKEAIDSQNTDISSLNIQMSDTDTWSIKKIEELQKNNRQSWNNFLYKIQRPVQKLKNKTSQSLTQEESITMPNTTSKFLDLYKVMPLWNSQIRKANLEKPQNDNRSILANFVRRLLPGAIRARRRKALAWNTYQNKPHAPIFLRAINSLSLENALHGNEANNLILVQTKENANKQNVHILKTRWDFTPAHFVRGMLLCIQAYIRKYIRLPFLIILKNISRQLLFQSTEWQKDWKDLEEELYIDCDYDGNDLYVGIKFPNLLTGTGKQVKILRPFCLRYDRGFKPKEYKSHALRLSIAKASNYQLDNYSYLTIWGDEVVEPFGRMKKNPAFWQPIFQRINLIICHKIYKKFDNLIAQLQWISTYKEQFVNVIAKITQNLSTFLQINSEKIERPISDINKKEVENKDVQILVQKRETVRASKVDAFEDQKKSVSISDTINFKEENQENRRLAQTNLLNNKLNIKKGKINSEKLNQSGREFLKNNEYAAIAKIENQNIQKEDQNKEAKFVENLNTNENLYNNSNEFVRSTNKKIRKYSFRHNPIYIQKTLFHLKRSITQIQNNINYKINKNRTVIYRQLIKNTHQLLQVVKEIILSIRKLRIQTNIWLSEFLKSALLDMRSLDIKPHNKSTSYNKEEGYSSTYNTNLSQAYVLHTIWQENEMNRPNVTSVLKSWNPETILNNKLNLYFNEQGILQNKEPQHIKYNQWEAWLKTLPGYRPSLKIWRHIVPQYWTQAVTKYWSNVADPTSLKLENYNHESDNQATANYLSYHKPLLEKAQKFTKLWKFYLLTRNYTNFANDGDIETFQTFANKNLQKVLYNDLQKLRLDPKNRDREKILHNQLQSALNTGHSKKDTFANLTKTQGKNIQGTPIKRNLVQELPIIQKERTRMKSKLELNTIIDRLSFPPLRENRWKSKDLHNRFRKLMQAAKRKLVLKEAMVLNKESIAYGSHEMNQDFQFFLKKFPPEDVLFINMLENWRYKVLDDELLMYNMVSSFLRFAQKEENDLVIDDAISSEILKNSIPNTSCIIPEELLLPKSLRELRILENLDLKVVRDEDNKKNSNVITSLQNEGNDVTNKDTVRKYKVKKDNHNWNYKDNIMRFLWPTHRIEDLACMNRFSLGTTNQSRFSLLRIRPFLISLT